jgi:hypothetical protein
MFPFRIPSIIDDLWGRKHFGWNYSMCGLVGASPQRKEI